MYKNYRLFLQTSRRLYSVGTADTLPDLAQVLRRWLATSRAASTVYDDEIKAVMVYQFDPQTDAYIKRGTMPATSRIDAINQISAFTGV